MADVKVVGLKEAEEFMEGDERCHLYLKSDRMIFGTSYLEPGKEGEVDPGHKHGEEVFFVARGRVTCRFSETTKDLKEGDAAIIPIGEPHKLINNSDKPALVCWALAPPD